MEVGERSHPRSHPKVANALGAPSVKQWAQVMAATVLVVGGPVAVVWWLRASGMVTSPVLGVVLGMAASLSISQIGRALWARRPDSEDLLFSELMLWGFLRRRHSERRLVSATDMLGPIRDRRRLALAEDMSYKEQTELLERLVAGIETRDPYLDGHSRRVARHSWMIARRMGLHPAEVARIRTAAAIHDVGKIETPKAILHKPGALSAGEYEVMKRHPGDGARMVEVLGDDELTSMVRHHHERLDGSGYPNGLCGEAIPLGARIIAVADTFDAITSARPYRAARPHKQAIDILKDEAGTKLDPEVVRAFCSHYGGLRPIALWGTLAGVPERAASWLSGGVGGVASTAKAVAVAALIGSTAATTSAIVLPPAGRDSARTHPTSTARRQAQATGSTRGAAAAARGQAVIATARRAGPPAASGSTSSRSAVSAAHAAQPTQGSYVRGGPVQGAEPGTSETIGAKHDSRVAAAGEEARNKTERSHLSTVGSGKSEGPGGASEATHGQATETHGKAQEPQGTSEAASGRGAEPHGTGEVAHGASEAAPGKAEELNGSGVEAHGSSEEPRATGEHAAPKSEAAHGKA